MAHAQTSPIGRFIRRLSVAHLVAAAPDDELVERFAVHREEAAFTALVRRHGPLVLGVCRRVLIDPHAADDCFQETFLVLARKAGSLKRPGSLAPWLYGAATRTALKRLEGDGARLVLVIESSARHRALGRAAAEEWAAIKSEVNPGTPCVGWLCDHVAGYGRGVRPVDADGSLVVVALGDAPRR